MNLLNPLNVLALQSNNLIARALLHSGALAPDYNQYFTSFTGYFGAFFLMLISAIAGIIDNYGIAIILSVICVRVMLLPLTYQQIRGMKVMQMLQPVMKAIQNYYPDKQDQGTKTMELYSTYKVNPLAGCLPMLVQFPVMIGVYRALYDASFAGKSFLGIQLLFPVNLNAARNFGHGPNLSDVIDVTVAQLHLQGQIIHIPDGIPMIGGSYWYWPALILVALYVIMTYLMQRVMKKVNAPHPEFEAEFKAEVKTRDGEPQQPDMAAQMQKQMGLMNLFIIILAFIFSSGALLYFIVQNILMMIEYSVLPQRMKLAFNAKEMKAFVLRPPAPRGGAPAAPAARDIAAKPKISLPAVENAALNQDGEEPDGGSLDDAITSLQRPRRKRKKR
jgi:YidC/Oxa1 family membrane protein insertase